MKKKLLKIKKQFKKTQMDLTIFDRFKQTSIQQIKENTEESSSPDDNSLQLSKITLNDDYRKKWNVHENDFVCLTKNGKLLNSSLYRVGGFGATLTDNYFMILKYTEAYYDDNIAKDKSEKRHLSGHWCIIDKNGVEKVNCDRFATPYIKKDSCVYSIDGNHYNIETGEFYCNSRNSMSSDDYLFLENKHGNKSKIGVMKINKKDGTWELFPLKY